MINGIVVVCGIFTLLILYLIYMCYNMVKDYYGHIHINHIENKLTTVENKLKDGKNNGKQNLRKHKAVSSKEYGNIKE